MEYSYSYPIWVITLLHFCPLLTIICLCARPCSQGPRCRYAVGRILSEGEDKADEELLKRCGDSGLNVFSFPEATHVVTTSLPHRTVFSVPVGVGRVYPKLQHYIKVPTDPLLPLWLLLSTVNVATTVIFLEVTKGCDVWLKMSFLHALNLM